MMLPRGIALIKVPATRILVLSRHLTSEEERVARTMACDRVQRGAHAVILSHLDVAAVVARVREDVP